MQHCFKLPVTFLILAFTALVSVSRAQVVTSRFVSSDPLDNPAASTFRKNRGFFFKANRDEDRTNALELVNSTLGIETVTNVFQTALLYQSSNFFAEVNVAFQNGTKVTSSSLTVADATIDTTSNTNKNAINLIPVQLITGFRLSDSLRFGLKFVQTTAAVDSKNDYSFSHAEFSPYGRKIEAVTGVAETNTQKNQYMTIGAGAVINLFGTGFDIGLGADYMTVDYDQKIDGTATTTRLQNTSETETNSINRKKVTVIKELYGLSYLTQSPTFSFRTEINYQKMPPMDSVAALKIGELTRAMVEAIWTRLYGGVEVASKRGYFIDPNNLVPIYFNFAHLTGEAAFTYGFFAGFKLSAGNSFGASYYESTEQKHEQLSATDPTLYSIERKTRSFGLSYSYVF